MYRPTTIVEVPQKDYKSQGFATNDGSWKLFRKNPNLKKTKKIKTKYLEETGLFFGKIIDGHIVTCSCIRCSNTLPDLHIKNNHCIHCSCSKCVCECMSTIGMFSKQEIVPSLDYNLCSFHCVVCSKDQVILKYWASVEKELLELEQEYGDDFFDYVLC